MAELEDADKLITMRRAAELSGLTPDTLKQAAQDGRLQAERPGHDWLTTRRNLHRYLAGRKTGRRPPLPPDYQTPEGEEPIR
jgi:excisionase family DNA binding protein